MKDIKTLFEGLFSADVAELKAPEPIEIPEMDVKHRAFSIIKDHIQATNNAVKEQSMLARINKLKSVLDEFEPQEMADVKAIAKSARNGGKTDMWYFIQKLKDYLSRDFKIDNPEALDNYNLWAGFAKVLKKLFKDPLVKKYILSGDGLFFYEHGEVYWHQLLKTTVDVDAVVKKIQKILPSNLVSIVKKENWQDPKIYFDSAALSNY